MKDYQSNHKLGGIRAKEAYQMSSEELREQLKKLRQDKMRLDGLVGKKVEGLSGASKENRRSIARIITVLVKRGERCV